MHCTVIVNYFLLSMCVLIFVDYYQNRKIGVTFFVVHRYVLLCTNHCQLKVVYGKYFDFSVCVGTVNIVVLVCVYIPSLIDFEPA